MPSSWLPPQRPSPRPHGSAHRSASERVLSVYYIYIYICNNNNNNNILSYHIISYCNIYIYIHICMHVCINTYIYIYIYIHACMHVFRFSAHRSASECGLSVQIRSMLTYCGFAMLRIRVACLFCC